MGSSSVHHVAVDCLAWYGVAAGGPAGLPRDRYGPELRVRRGQMATFIARVLDRVDPALLSAADGESLCVPPTRLGPSLLDHPHADAIRRLAKAGVVSGGVGGAPADCFGPDLDVRLHQMASFLPGALELATGRRIRSDTDAFDDDDRNPHEAAIDALSAKGVVAGTGMRTYDPPDGLVPGSSAQRPGRRRPHRSSVLSRPHDWRPSAAATATASRTRMSTRGKAWR